MIFSKTVFACLFCILLLSGCRHNEDFSPAVKEFQDTKPGKDGVTLHFYPSTIEMLNINKDSAFSALVKDIKKLKIVTFKADSSKTVDFSKLIQGLRKESFVDLMQMKQGSQRFLIFLRKENNEPKEFAGIIESENNVIIVDLLGSIPMSSLPSLLNGNIKLSGFTSVFNAKSSIQSKQKHGKHSSDK